MRSSWAGDVDAGEQEEINDPPRQASADAGGPTGVRCVLLALVHSLRTSSGR